MAVTKLGGEFIANTSISGDQQAPTITALTNGGFVAAWWDASGSQAIKAQLFDANGAKVGSELVVHSGSANNPVVTDLSDGGFVITWGITQDVRGQVFDASGAEVGSEFDPSPYGAANQSVTGLADGGFVVTWDDNSGTLGDLSGGIHAQLFDASGVQVGSQFLVNTATADTQTLSTVTGLTNGSFVATWQDYSGTLGDSSGASIKAQLFSTGGARIGSEFLVNTTTANDQRLPSVAELANGGFVVTWEDHFDIKGQVFDASGAKVGAEFDPSTFSGQFGNPTVTGLANGGFVVTWVGANFGLGDGSGILAQEFDASGAKVGSEFLVNTTTANQQVSPSITGLRDGGLAVAWQHHNDGDFLNYIDIRAQLFAVNAAPVTGAPPNVFPSADGSFVFSVAANTAITISDADGDSLTMTLDVLGGTLTLATTNGLTSVSGNGTGQVVIAGSMPDLHAALDGLVYWPSAGDGDSDRLTIATTDGTLTDTDVVAIPLSGDDDLYGNGGNESIDGGAGLDTLHLTGARSDYVIRLASGSHDPTGTYTITDKRAGSPDGVDTVKNVEFLAFADGVVTIDITSGGAGGGEDAAGPGYFYHAYGGDGGSGFDGSPGRDGEPSPPNVIGMGAGGGGGGGAGGGHGGRGGTGVGGGAGGATPGADGQAGGDDGGDVGGGGGGGGGAHGLVGAFAGGVNAGALQGGDGGRGGDLVGNSLWGGGGGGGAGGYGAMLRASGQNNGVISGGNGGRGGNKDIGGLGGDAGVGVHLADGLAFTNMGSVAGGNGGAPGIGTTASGTWGLGGTGIRGLGVAITNGGSITGGSGAVGQANAITFTGGVNSLTLLEGSIISGNVVGNGDDTLRLAGGGDRNFDVSVLGHAAQYRGFENFAKSGAGVVTLTGANSAAMEWSNDEGVLLVTGAMSAATFNVASGATLGGDGAVGAVTVQSGGVLSPGDGPGFLDTGNVALNSGGMLKIAVDGTAVGSEYDQLRVTGSVELHGDLFLDYANSMPFGSFIIIDNDAADAIVGGFSNIVEGQQFFVSGQNFVLSYHGGDGNDVVLTTINDAPSGADATKTILEDLPHTFSVADFGFTDTDGHVLSGVRITAVPQVGALTLDSLAVTAGQLISAADIAAGKLKFAPAPNASGFGYASFTFQVQDDGGTASGGVHVDQSPNTFTFHVTSQNDRPVVTASSGSTAAIEGLPVAIDSGITLSDVDDGHFAAAQVRIAGNFRAGEDMLAFINTDQTAYGGITATYNAGTGVLSLNAPSGASTAQVQAALSAVTYTNISDAPDTSTRSIEFTVRDADADGWSNGATHTVSVTPLNDAPTIAAPAVIELDEGSALEGLVIGFADADGGNATVTLQVASGRFEVAGTIDPVIASGSGTGTLTMSGPIASINSVLAGANVVYYPVGDVSGDVALNVSIDDGGNSGQDPGLTGTATSEAAATAVILRLRPQNDQVFVVTPHDNPLTGDPTTAEDTPIVIPGLSITDVDAIYAPDGVYQVTLDVSRGGVLTLPGTTGLSFTQGDGAADAEMTFHGRLADINTALAALTFDPALNFNGVATVLITARDHYNSVVATGQPGAGTSDGRGFDVTVTPENDAPVITSNSSGASASISVAENQIAVTRVTSSDPDDRTWTYSINGGADAAKFAINPTSGALTFIATPNFEAANNVGPNNVYDVVVRATDSDGLFDSQAIAVTVTNVNEAPTTLVLSNASIAENSPIGTVIGTLSASDPDAGSTFTFAELADPDGKFFVSGNQLLVAGGLDFEAATSHSVTLRVADGGGLTFDRVFSITVTDVDETPPNRAPTAIALAPSAIGEFPADGAVAGTLAATDPDAGDTATFALVSDAGGRFALSGSQITVTSGLLLDFENQGSHEITVRATDAGGLSVEQAITITIGNVDPEVLTGTPSVDLFLGGALADIFSGLANDDRLEGNGGDDRLFGGAGADTLIGGLGNDVLDGGSNPEGASGQGDVLLGGEGDDTYHVDSGLDLVDEGSYFPGFGFGGFDTIISTTDFYWDIASVGERLVVSEEAVDIGGDGVTIVGSVFDNKLIGHSGTDVMFGRGGSDTYRAGDGVDFMSLSTLGLTDANSYAGVNGSNTVIVDPRTGGLFSYDIVFEFETGKDKLDVSAFSAVNGFASGADVMARGVNVDFDGDGLFTGPNDSSYFILGDGLDYLYMVGTTLDEMSAGDFIV